MTSLRWKTSWKRFFVSKRRKFRNFFCIQIFLAKYNIRLRYPFLPVAKCGGKGVMLPLEVLKIAPRQRYQKKLGDQQLATLIRSAAKPADERQREIEGWVRKAAINQDPVSQNFLTP